MIKVVEVVSVHVVDQLLEHDSLQHLAQDGQDAYWSVVLGVQLTALQL